MLLKLKVSQVSHKTRQFFYTTSFKKAVLIDSTQFGNAFWRVPFDVQHYSCAVT